jgi:hypothetical protein
VGSIDYKAPRYAVFSPVASSILDPNIVLLKHPQPMFLSQCERPSFTTIKTTGKIIYSLYLKLYLFVLKTGRQKILHWIIESILWVQSTVLRRLLVISLFVKPEFCSPFKYYFPLLKYTMSAQCVHLYLSCSLSHIFLNVTACVLTAVRSVMQSRERTCSVTLKQQMVTRWRLWFNT